MLANLIPNQYYQDIFSIDLDLLQKQGIKGIICDIDNTIVPWEENEILQEVIDWFADLKANDFKVCLVSNGKDKRVQLFSQKLGLPAISKAIKPAKKAFKIVKAKLNLRPEEIAVIGDQIFTDILGGNRMGFETILVNPMSKKESSITKITRSLEKKIFKRKEFT